MTEGIGHAKLPYGCECVSSVANNFSYYEKPVVEVGQSSFREEKIIPTNGIWTNPYEFKISASPDYFLCLNNIPLYIKARIVKNDGSLLGDAHDDIAVANNLIGSMWKTVETKLNDETISPSSQYHAAYKSYLETIFSYDSTTKGAL